MTICVLACVAGSYSLGETSGTDRVAATENIYADVLDSYGAFSTIDSGLMKTYEGKDREAWRKVYREKRAALVASLANISPRWTFQERRSGSQLLMRAALSDFPEDASTLAPRSKCKSAQDPNAGYDALRAALYSCFDELANNLQFEGGTINRVSAFSLLGQINEQDRRKRLFLSFSPLWEALNGKDQPDSPYRRMIRMAAEDNKKNKPAVVAAAESLGVQPTDVEIWLQEILETWREVSGDTPIEPWDYDYVGGKTGRLWIPPFPGSR